MKEDPFSDSGVLVILQKALITLVKYLVIFAHGTVVRGLDCIAAQ